MYQQWQQCIPDPIPGQPHRCNNSLLTDFMAAYFMQEGSAPDHKRVRRRSFSDDFMDLVREIDQDLISYFTQHLLPPVAPKLYAETRQLLSTDRRGRVHTRLSGPSGVWTRKEACIHVRLGDVQALSTASMHTAVYDRAIEMLNADWSNADARTLDAFPIQAPLQAKSVRELVHIMRHQNPGLPVVVYACDGAGGRKVARLVGADEGRCNSQRDVDMLELASCEVTAATRSSFSLAALLFFSGRTAYSPIWRLAVSCGLFTARDKTGFKSVATLLTQALHSNATRE